MAIETAKVQDVITTFRPTRQFKAPPSHSYTSIDFDDSGEFLLLSRTDDTIQLFNTRAGAQAKELKSQKYGNALARFTHHATSILYASTKVDDGIRYLSMHDNSFIRYFRGHTAAVTSLCVSPGADTFLSASLDNTVRLWDCRTPNAQGQLAFASPWLAAYDPSATVIAVASPPAQHVLLYDLKNYDKPPFGTFDLLDAEKRVAAALAHRARHHRQAQGWSALEFSNNGKFVLVATNGAGHYVLDAFSGELVHFLLRPSGSSGRVGPGDSVAGETINGQSASGPTCQGDASFSPDGRYVVGGNGAQAGLLVWDCFEREKPDKILEPLTDLPCGKPAAVVAYNPRHNLLACADKEVMLWLPDPDLA